MNLAYEEKEIIIAWMYEFYLFLFLFFYFFLFAVDKDVRNYTKSHSSDPRIYIV